MIVSGVLSGSRGALYYPQEEIDRSPDSWNGMPLMLGHPVINGTHVSARDPDVLEKYGLGHIFRSKAKGPLDGEAWFDVEAVKRVSKRVLNALEKGLPLEVSTGLFINSEPAPEGATHNSMPYQFVARNFKPDHLAVLLDAKGACSLADGCGILRNNVCETCGREPDSIEDNTVKNELIAWLTTNCDCWKGDKDKETLNAFDEAKLTALKDTAEKVLASNTLVANLRTELEAAKATTAPAVNTGPRLTPDEAETLKWANEERQRQKALLVEKLLGNVTDPKERQIVGNELMQEKPERLQTLVKLIGNQTSTPAVNFDFTKPIPNYAGAAGGPAIAVQDDDPNDYPPTVNETYPDPRDAWRKRHSA
jgi:hypothetical protein